MASILYFNISKVKDSSQYGKKPSSRIHIIKCEAGSSIVEFTVFAFLIFSILTFTFKIHHKLNQHHISIIKKTSKEWRSLEKKYGTK